MSTLSANIVIKARKLCDAGRVVPLGIVRLDDDGHELPSGRTEVFEVRGDRGTYPVMIGSGHVACGCAARGTCSHIAAVLLLGLREQRPPRHRRPLPSPSRSSIQPTTVSR
jgi:hypothetical protein